MATTYDKASLVMIPSGYKDDKLYSIKPTDGSGDFTFSRDGAGASPATRVNASGLIEKGRENVLLQSNQFDTTWSNVLSGSITGGQSGYDGSNDAWELSKGATAYRYIVQNISQSGVNTFSIYAKAGTLNQVTIFNDTGATNPYAKFSLVDGSLVASSGIIDSNATDVGGGWWRFSMTFNATITTARIYPDFAETTAGTIYIQDAQLEQGLIATSVIETTTAPVSAGLLGNMPRLDYSGGATCPSLLLEPSRVNNIANSEYIGAATSNNITTTDNSATSPEGVTNAASIIPTTANALHYIDFLGAYPTTIADYTFSIYAKANGANYIYMRYPSPNAWAGFNLSTGVKISENGFSADIEDAGNGWYRIYGTINHATGNSKAAQVFVSSNEHSGDPAVTETQDGTSGVFIYGAQLESSASYVSSYIPTYGSASTRGADSCSKTGISSLIGQTEGTLFFELDKLNDIDVPVITIDDNTNSNRILFATQLTTGYWGIFTASSGTGSFSYGTTTGTSGKFALAYSSAGYSLYRNGVEVASHTAALPTSLSAIRLNGRATGDLYGIKGIKQALVFKTRLTNAELAALTA